MAEHSLLIQIAELFSFLAIGFIAGKLKMVSQTIGNYLANFVIYLALPIQIFLDITRVDHSLVFYDKYFLTYLFSTFALWIVIFITSKYKFSNDSAGVGLDLIGAGQSNTGYFAIPIFLILFNDTSPVVPIIIFQLTILTTICLMMINYQQNSNQKSIGAICLITIKKVFLDTIILSATFGFICYLYQIHLPMYLEEKLSIVGQLASPIALATIGLSLSNIDVSIFKKKYEIFCLTGYKILLHPLFTLVIGKWIFQLSKVALCYALVISAMPSPKNMSLFARKYKLDVQKSDMTVLITTMLSFISILIIISWIKY
jgi:malonate transporter and related proteins